MLAHSGLGRFGAAVCTVAAMTAWAAHADEAPGPPKVVSVAPDVGQAEVDPATAEIVVTFDRDMATGFSWTGGGEAYPEIADKPFWRTPKECVLPVTLEPGRFYRVGLNSTSHRNFKSAAGEPLPPSAVYFATAGADEATKAQLAAPAVVEMNPPNGAKDVSADTTTIAVTFNTPMGGGMSWTGAPADKPEFTAPPVWSEDKRTCTATVKMAPGKTYTLSLNSAYHINFNSESGVPLAPVAWTFTTAE